MESGNRELDIKISETISQYYIDKFFEMEPMTFWSGIELLPEKRNHVPFNREGHMLERYGTYEQQMERLKVISDDLCNALISDNPPKLIIDIDQYLKEKHGSN